MATDPSARLVVATLLIGGASASCSAELPECPPGTDFDDCRPSTATGAVQPAATAGAGGNAPAQGGSGGSAGSPATAAAGTSGSERPPVSEGDDLDPPLFGALIEFRIYARALSLAQLRTSFQAGPGALN